MPASDARTQSSKGLILLATLALGLLLHALYWIFAVAPVEAQMGIVQKIFYFHVPSAYCMYVGFVVSGLASAAYLIRRREGFDAVAVAGAEVGLVFCVIVLTTGPLWARKAWGEWWVWDPRLTSTMLAGMIFAAYGALRSFGSGSQAERLFAAALSILGLPIMWVIHESVKLWRGQHPTVIRDAGGGLHPDMGSALAFSFLAFTFVVALLIWMRARVERLHRRVQQLELDAAERGLLEGG